MQGSDPISGMRFALEIDGIEVAWFSSCRGLAAKRGTFEIEEGGLNDRVHVRVGAEQPGQVTLEAPTSVSQALWA